jgi:hypothetical protein
VKTLATARLKRVLAVELLADGLSYSEIAERVGFRHRASAFRAVSQALAEREVAGVDDLRAIEVARLDRLQTALWDKALMGDTRAVAGVVRIIAMRVRLLGLDRQGPLGADEPGPALVIGPAEGNPGQATGDATCMP